MINNSRLLKAYLGHFLAKPSAELKEELRSVDVNGCYLIVTKQYRPAISFLLVKDGRQNYRVLTSSQVIDVFLGKEEDLPTYRDIVDPVVMVTVSRAEMENKRRWELIYQLALERRTLERGLIVFADEMPSNVREFRELGFVVMTCKALPSNAEVF